MSKKPPHKLFREKFNTKKDKEPAHKITKHCKNKEYLIINKRKKEQRHTPCLWIGSLNALKIAIIFKLIHRANVNPIMIPPVFCRNWQEIQNFCEKPCTQNIQNNPAKE